VEPNLSPETATLALAIGLVFALGCYLVTNLSPGGMITPAWLAVTLVTGRCTADTQVVLFGQSAGSPNAIVVSPSTAQFLASVPGGDDVYVAPGIPCTEAADCSAGANCPSAA